MEDNANNLWLAELWLAHRDRISRLLEMKMPPVLRRRLSVEDLTQEPHYRHISLSVRAGEVLGVTGLLGDGRSVSFRTVFGDAGKYQGSIIVGGKPHHGMIHPECGHIPVNRRADDPMVRGICPYHGSCLEGLASGPAIESRWGRSPAELADCEAVWALEAYYLGQAVCSYIYTISPERIVFGGGVMNQKQLLPLIRAEVSRQLCGYIQGKGLNDLDSYIVPSALDGRQGIIGCLVLGAQARKEARHEV